MGLPHPAEVRVGQKGLLTSELDLEDCRTTGRKIGQVFPTENARVKLCGLREHTGRVCSEKREHVGVVGCGAQGLAVEAQGWEKSAGLSDERTRRPSQNPGLGPVLPRSHRKSKVQARLGGSVS